MERSAYLWYLPGDVAGLARRLAAGGCGRVYVKAGVDNAGGPPLLWTRAGAGPTQWDEETLRPFGEAGIEACPFVYVTGGRQFPVEWEIAAIVEVLRARAAPILMLNPEVEWGGRSNDEAADYVRRLRAAIAAAGLPTPAIGFSSVPSWDGGIQGRVRAIAFPYEGFAGECDGPQMPQVYWRRDVLDQIAYCNRRTPAGKTVVPILPACQREDPGGAGMTWTDEAIAALAGACAADLRGFGGFSSWQAGATGAGGRARADYAGIAMACAYDLCPHDGPAATLARALREEADAAAEPWHCPETDKWVIGPFRRAYAARADALTVFGLPVSDEFFDRGRGLTVQYFERARFERPPTSDDPADITYGRVGAELLERLGLAA